MGEKLRMSEPATRPQNHLLRFIFGDARIPRQIDKSPGTFSKAICVYIQHFGTSKFLKILEKTRAETKTSNRSVKSSKSWIENQYLPKSMKLKFDNIDQICCIKLKGSSEFSNHHSETAHRNSQRICEVKHLAHVNDRYDTCPIPS